MGRAVPIWSNFNSGELSPFLDGRVDNAKYYSGLHICHNFIPTISGPITRRRGTQFVAPLKNTGFTRAIPFRFSADQNYVLEFGNAYIRFWRNRAQLLSGFVPYEIVSPFVTSDLPNLRFIQSFDVMYIASGRLPVKKLIRLGDTNWTISDAPFQYGPLATQNVLKPNKMYYTDPDGDPGNVGNVVTLTSTFNYFTSGMVGTLLELEWETRPDLKVWQVDEDYNVGDLVYYQGNVYRSVVDVGTTGTTPPTHTEGEGQDGGGGTWLYLHSGYGLVQITAVTNATTATATVVTRLPIDMLALAGATYRWTRSAYGNDIGWPTCVSLFRERLVLSSALRIDLSVANAFETWNTRDAGRVQDDLAINVLIASGTVDSVEWLCPDSNGLVIGTRAQEFILDEASSNAPFGSSNFRIRPQSQYGSQNNAQFVAVGTSIVYAQRTGKRLLAATYDYSQLKLVSENLSVYAEHLLNPGILDMTYQQQPWSVIWLLMKDGTLVGWTYDQLNGVIAGHGHPMENAFIESITTIPAPAGDIDDLWLFIRRTINGATVRYAEFIGGGSPDITLQQAFFVDSGLQYSGAETPTLSGLNHLIGQTVDVLGNGAVQTSQVVDGAGTITLQYPVTTASVGLHTRSVAQTMRVEAGATAGTSQGSWKRINEIILRVYNSLGGLFGPSIFELDVIPTRAGQVTNMDEPPPAFTGDIDLSFPGNWRRDGYVTIIQDQPLPMTIVAIIPKLNVNE